MSTGWLQAVEKTVTGLGYELVDCERSMRGLLAVFIDRVPGHSYAAGPGEVVTVDDCEAVTRQLQHVLEVEGCDYERLEVSSPGVDRPLKTEAHYRRFVGELVDLALKHPFQGRKKYQGALRLAEVPQAEGAVSASFELVFNDGQADQVLGFELNEVREARLVPPQVFKGRNAVQGKGAGKPAPAKPRKLRSGGKAPQANAKATAVVNQADGAAESGGHEE